MIVTLTLNPSLDLTYDLAEVDFGSVEVHRATSATVEASGKGVNVSRDLYAAGVTTVAVLPCGGATGTHLAGLLAQEGVAHVAVPCGGDTRINTSLLLAAGETRKVNGPGCGLTRDELDDLVTATGDALDAAPAPDAERWLVVAGSLPPGLDPGIVGELVALAHEHAATCAVDASGPALAAALHAGADLLAPNRFELAELAGEEARHAPVDRLGRIACRLAGEHGSQLLVSLGSEGALHTDGREICHGHGPALVPVNTAGAGDAFLAGWLSEPGTPTERMSRALAWGRSACLCPMTVDDDPGSRGGAGITVRPIDPLARPTRPEPGSRSS